MYLFRLEKVARVGEEHLFHARVEHDRRHRALVPRVRPAPSAMRVRKVDLDAVYRLGLVLFLRLQHQLLQDRVVPRDDAVTAVTTARWAADKCDTDLIESTSTLLPYWSSFLLLFTRSQWLRYHIVCVLSNVGWNTTFVRVLPGVRSMFPSSSSGSAMSPSFEVMPGEIVRVVVSNSREHCHSGRFESQSINQS